VLFFFYTQRYHPPPDDSDLLGFFSCDACATYSMSDCPTQGGCEWIKEEEGEGGDVGMCIPSQTTLISCEILSKSLCDMYSHTSTYIPGVSVSDAPCFFNGPSDSLDTLCVSQSSLLWNDCTGIRTNGIVLYEGVERKSCDEAHILFNWIFSCIWITSESVYWDEDGFCQYIYYLYKSLFYFFY
jgi:hypothetical protein